MSKLFDIIQRQYLSQVKKRFCERIRATKTIEELDNLLREIVYVKEDMDFLQKNMERLNKKYIGKWIVITDRKVVYNCSTREEMNEWLKEHPIKYPRQSISHYVEPNDVVY